MKTRNALAAATVILISALTFSPVLYASELSVYGTLTTQYIYRGLNISDNNPALQAGIDNEHDSNVFVGAWVSTIDLSTANGGRDLESNYYAGYHHKIAGNWAATWTLLRYGYPCGGGEHN